MSVERERRKIALACENGQIRIFSYSVVPTSTPNGFIVNFKPSSILRGFKGRALSCCWVKTPDSTKNKGVDVWASSTEGQIYGWRLSNSGPSESSPCTQMNLTDRLVWSMVSMVDNDVPQLITGDSTGCIVFWNTNTRTRKQEITRHLNNTDVTSLWLNKSCSDLFSGGTDGLVVQYSKYGKAESKTGDTKLGPSTWYYNTHRDYHQMRDVWAVVVSENSGKEMVVSGSNDSRVAMCRLESFKTSQPVYYYSLPDPSSIHWSVEWVRSRGNTNGKGRANRKVSNERNSQNSANNRKEERGEGSDNEAKKRLMLVRDEKDSKLKVWKFYSESLDFGEFPTGDKTKNPCFLMKITPNMSTDPTREVQKSLLCSAFSKDCKYIVCSNGIETKVWVMRLFSDDSVSPKLTPLHKKKAIPGAIQVALAGDILIIATPDSLIHLIDLCDGNDIIHTFKEHAETCSSIMKLSVSRNCKWLVSSDRDNNTHVYDLELKKIHHKIPKFHQSLNCLEFLLNSFVEENEKSRENSGQGTIVKEERGKDEEEGKDEKDQLPSNRWSEWENILLITLLDNSYWFYDVQEQNVVVSSADDRTYQKASVELDKIVGFSFNPQRNLLLLHSNTTMLAVHLGNKKHVNVVTDFSLIVGVKFFGYDELAVLEIPWYTMTGHLHLPVARPKFGCFR
eukprot:TRINITY_DN7052_c0_g3_i1.p1 TRINITY_DN7052_c0_g3~~TRINITY_DN7052_c0_g3_i1.p1  ORF type:complete len:721 (+),score=118.54 TRINITY_DN7052_c0_g3_i1:133-2163(+)